MFFEKEREKGGRSELNRNKDFERGCACCFYEEELITLISACLPACLPAWCTCQVVSLASLAVSYGHSW